MGVRLYTIPGSHPGISAQLMLRHKGIAFDRTDLMPVVSKGVLKVQRFPGVTDSLNWAVGLPPKSPTAPIYG